MIHSVNSPEFIKLLVRQCQMDGYEVVGIDEVMKRIINPSKKFVCFTFDDGYLDTYTIAYPTLTKLNVPYCVYMTRDFYRGKAQPIWDSSALMMSAEQLKEMSENPLCTVGVHTCSHPHLGKLGVEEQRYEILECKNDLESLLGLTIWHMAYPHGDYNEETLNIVSELGFKTAVTTSGRYVRDDSKPFELDRVFV